MKTLYDLHNKFLLIGLNSEFRNNKLYISDCKFIDVFIEYDIDCKQYYVDVQYDQSADEEWFDKLDEVYNYVRKLRWKKN